SHHVFAVKVPGLGGVQQAKQMAGAAVETFHRFGIFAGLVRDELGPAPIAPVQNPGGAKGNACAWADPLRQSEPGRVDRDALRFVDDLQTRRETDNLYVSSPSVRVREPGADLLDGSRVLSIWIGSITKCIAGSKKPPEVFTICLQPAKKLGRFLHPQRNRCGQ